VTDNWTLYGGGKDGVTKFPGLVQEARQCGSLPKKTSSDGLV